MNEGTRVLLGIGVASYVEVTAGAGCVRVRIGGGRRRGGWVLPGRHRLHGQGHETTFAMIVADRPGVALDDIEFV